MAFENPKLDKVLQIGILVKDLDAAKKNYEEVLGIGPWDEPFIMSGKNIDLYVNGERYYGDFMKVAMLHRYGFEIELIEPIDPSPLKDWVDKHGSGLHHLDFNACVDRRVLQLRQQCSDQDRRLLLRGLSAGRNQPVVLQHQRRR